jgi:hypothetical protein
MLCYKSWASFEPFYVISNAHNVDNVFKNSTLVCLTRKNRPLGLGDVGVNLILELKK